MDTTEQALVSFLPFLTFSLIAKIYLLLLIFVIMFYIFTFLILNLFSGLDNDSDKDKYANKLSKSMPNLIKN